LAVCLLIVVMLCFGYIFQDKKLGKGVDTKIKYELVSNWPKLPDSVTLGNPTGIGLDTNQNIFIFHRASRTWPLIAAMPTSFIKEKTILVIDKDNGNLLNSWGANLFIMPHGLTIDNHNNVWVTDVGLHQVFKFTHEGQLIMKLGEANVSGKDSFHFNKPTDVAIAKDGSFYVSDGYGNSRIVKFSASGKYILEWGKKGTEDGNFNIPHGVDIDDNGNVYVADRENNRIQVFDSVGKFLKKYTNKTFANICAITIDKNDKKLFTTDDLSFLKLKHRGSDVFSLDTLGIVQTRFGRSGSYYGSTCWYHDITIDAQQNIYVGDILGNRVQKFRKIASK
jgi:peptidylamidoglycolate lyase